MLCCILSKSMLAIVKYLIDYKCFLPVIANPSIRVKQSLTYEAQTDCHVVPPRNDDQKTRVIANVVK